VTKVPEDWQEWVYPWVPQHYLGDGIRGIIYLGMGPFDVGFTYWMTLYGIAAVVLLLALVVPQRKKIEDAGSPQSRPRGLAAARECRMQKIRERRAAHTGKHATDIASAGAEGEV
jgi:hypothetical protein